MAGRVFVLTFFFCFGLNVMLDAMEESSSVDECYPYSYPVLPSLSILCEKALLKNNASCLLKDRYDNSAAQIAFNNDYNAIAVKINSCMGL